MKITRGQQYTLTMNAEQFNALNRMVMFYQRNRPEANPTDDIVAGQFREELWRVECEPPAFYAARNAARNAP